MAALLGRSLQRSLIAFRAGEQGVQQITQLTQRVGGDQRGPSRKAAQAALSIHAGNAQVEPFSN
jgi:hypothetical protein